MPAGYWINDKATYSSYVAFLCVRKGKEVGGGASRGGEAIDEEYYET